LAPRFVVAINILLDEVARVQSKHDQLRRG
jgi:hypothetical protein